MITDKDIVKLKKTFVTKRDLKKYATKNDLSGFAKQITAEFIEYVGAMNEGMKKEIIDELRGDIQTLTKELSQILPNHEKRITNLEQHAFS
jgi:hypothetical protein